MVEQPGAWGAEAARSRASSTARWRPRSTPPPAGTAPACCSPAGPASAAATTIASCSWPTRASSGAGSSSSTLPADDPAALLAIDLGALAFPDPPGLGEPGPLGLHLVCTNGRHDPCCADIGRPVVRALVDAGSPDVWECSHVGGDRFAANIVCLPDGVYYGRVEPQGAARLLAEHRAGLLDLDHYRGRSCYPPLVQAAEAFAREHLGERRLDGVVVLSTEPGPEGAVAVVVEQRGGDALEVIVRRERAGPAQLTCHVHRDSTPWRYLLVEVRAA